MNDDLIAHVRQNDEGSWDAPHKLIEHLAAQLVGRNKCCQVEFWRMGKGRRIDP